MTTGAGDLLLHSHRPTVVRLTAGKPSQLGHGARFIPSNLVRCEQFDNDIPVAFRIHL